MSVIKEKINQHLEAIYIDKQLDEAKILFDELFNQFEKINFKQRTAITHENVYLITYGDSFIEGNRPSLQVLGDILRDKLADIISDVHLLPMFPYTSDDGFSVVDYYQIQERLGDWDDIAQLSHQNRLMFDFVVNHMSQSSEWFQNFLNNQSDFQAAFVEYDENFDASKVVRPRVSPLFHDYQLNQDKKRVWTTFSEDQVDTNVRDPKMLARLTEVLLNYSALGATSIRLDAIGFMWKSSGTTCMHLPQTHEIVKLWRTLLDYFAPHTQIITETNVPHQENISYFGNDDEANQVYQFPLPPLTLHTFISGNAQKISDWAKTIHRVSSKATYFNFLASHDGIGLRPVENILSEKEINQMVAHVEKNGGKVSMKTNTDGTQSVYEMNINYSEALKDLAHPEETPQKMLAAHAILLSLMGVPAIYYHSIFGSKNDYQGLNASGINRRINRQKLEKNQLYQELQADAYRQQIYHGIAQLIKIRKNNSVFSPYNDQEILDLDTRLFAVRRSSKAGSIVSVVNISRESVILPKISGKDLITDLHFEENQILAPYQYVWLEEFV
ncbi:MULTISPECIES: sugar phosphorylase [unclassified Enterococcus]|uniref:sugar phosphorylase n=1 Tax=unclassified Enterococcus TaxID=2608891 RepID=UPI0015575BC4|nr:MULTISPECIES: sugar phosphorylase [unclassified Enterococcus]MBS7578233.1 sugar phosphorylase [Enterococcus sp. MMGLQ5-2]MBS7585528.1 sugar phosphorylase [Enterococcus sp. MMGLQ5-1]NPD13387.1 sugar phosphorylase [Enterococcus sp. MMGLQ5-1]NPD38064.1 sugar phosphorylase [Enterococcus sp. MMGLQ5-2]